MLGATNPEVAAIPLFILMLMGRSHVMRGILVIGCFSVRGGARNFLTGG